MSGPSPLLDSFTVHALIIHSCIRSMLWISSTNNVFKCRVEEWAHIT